MTSLAVRVPIVNGEAFACSAIECTITSEAPGGCAGREKGITALSTEEVLRVVCALAESIGLAESYIVLVRNLGLAVVAPGSKILNPGQ